MPRCFCWHLNRKTFNISWNSTCASWFVCHHSWSVLVMNRACDETDFKGNQVLHRLLFGSWVSGSDLKTKQKRNRIEEWCWKKILIIAYGFCTYVRSSFYVVPNPFWCCWRTNWWNHWVSQICERSNNWSVQWHKNMFNSIDENQYAQCTKFPGQQSFVVGLVLWTMSECEWTDLSSSSVRQ